MPTGGSVPEANLDEELRLRLLRLLTESPELSQRELAHRLGLSLGKTNYCLRALIDKGWIKVKNFRNSQNKLAYAYVLTPSGLGAKASATTAFLRRKQEEFAQLEQEIMQLRREVSEVGAPFPPPPRD
jgi:EPS-associated MarR family transcriptional regulator